MPKTTIAVSATVATTGKHSFHLSAADKFAGTSEKGGAAAPPPIRQALGTGTNAAWKSKLPVPTRKTSGGGAAGRGTTSLGATATGSGLSGLPAPKISGRGASRLPIPTRKTPGGASATSRLPALSSKTPEKTTGPPRKTTRTATTPKVPKMGVASPAVLEGNKIEQQKTKAKSPTPTSITRTANDTARKLAGGQVGTPPKSKLPSATLPKSSLSSAKVHGTARAAATIQRQNRPQPPPTPARAKSGVSCPPTIKSTMLAPPAASVTPVITSIAPVVVPVIPVVPPRVFVPLPSTYHRVKVCEGECLKPFPTELQQAAGAMYLQRRRPRFAPQPGRPQIRAKRVITAGSHYKRKPLPGASPLKQCLSEEEVITRKMIIRVKGKVVAPHLGPKGRPNVWKDPNKFPIAIRMHFHRKLLMEKGRSPWGPYLRELADGEQ